MRMTPVSVTFRDHEWETICDALTERRETILDNMGWGGESDRIARVDVAKINRLITEIESKVAD